MNKTIKIILIVLAIPVGLFLLFVSYQLISFKLFGSPGKPKNADEVIRTGMVMLSRVDPPIENFCNNENYAGVRAEVEKVSENNSKCFSDKDSFVWVTHIPAYGGAGQLRNIYFCVDSNKMAEVVSGYDNDMIQNADTLCPGNYIE